MRLSALRAWLPSSFVSPSRTVSGGVGSGHATVDSFGAAPSEGREVPARSGRMPVGQALLRGLCTGVIASTALLFAGCAHHGAPLDLREGSPASVRTDIDVGYEVTVSESDLAELGDLEATTEARVEQAAQELIGKLQEDLQRSPFETLERLRRLTPDGIASMVTGAVVPEIGDGQRVETRRDARSVLVYDGEQRAVRGAEVDGDVPTVTARALLEALPPELIEALHDQLADAGGMPRVFDEAAARLDPDRIDAAHVIAVAKVLHPDRADAIDATVSRWVRADPRA